jgi:hypothetical protein
MTGEPSKGRMDPFGIKSDTAGMPRSRLRGLVWDYTTGEMVTPAENMLTARGVGSRRLVAMLAAAVADVDSATLERTLTSTTDVYEQLLTLASATVPPQGLSQIAVREHLVPEALKRAWAADVREALEQGAAVAEADLMDALATPATVSGKVALTGDELDETNRLLRELIGKLDGMAARAKLGPAQALAVASFIVAVVTLAVMVLAWQHPVAVP